VAISGCIALQGALVAALSGYETAEEAHVLAPGSPGDAPRIAAIPLLLRNCASPACLQAPERLSGFTAARRHALALVEVRNRAVHLSVDGAPLGLEDVPAHMAAIDPIIRHLTLVHPSFPAGAAGRSPQAIERALVRLAVILC